MKYCYLLMVLLVSFVPLYSQPVPLESSNGSQNEANQGPPQNRRNVLSWFKDPAGARYFSINPGIQYISSAFTSDGK